MFQFKRRTSDGEANPTNVDPNTALPNSYGKIRTLKEDYENFKSGNLKEESADPGKIAASPEIIPSPTPDPQPAAPLPQSPQPEIKLPEPEEKKAERPAPAPHEMKSAGKETLNPFGSQTFFNDKSPFEEEKKDAPSEEKTVTEKPKDGSKKTLVVVFSLLLVLAIIGGGFYYYWFFMKKLPPQENVSTPVKPENETPQPEAQPENENLRRLNISAGSPKEENQKILRDFADSFLSSASENDIIEVKILDKEDRAVSPKDLETSLGFALPAGLAENLSDDYSFFVKKENSEARIGAAFKLSATEGLSENLKQQEKILPSNLSPFYLGQTPIGEITGFNSSRYINADIRYFNFSAPPNTSFDYSIITDKQNSYFIFATSKYCIRSVLDYMSEK